MSPKAILILAGVVVMLLGFTQLASSPRGAANRGFHIANVGVNTGITGPHQSVFGARATSKSTTATQPQPIGVDWISLATVAVGFIIALVGILRA